MVTKVIKEKESPPMWQIQPIPLKLFRSNFQSDLPIQFVRVFEMSRRVYLGRLPPSESSRWEQADLH